MDWTAYLPLIVLLVLFVGMFYFLTIRPQRKRQQEHNELIEGLRRGDRVITAGGIHGEIDLVDEETVVLMLEDGARLRVLKHSIVRKQGE